MEKAYRNLGFLFLLLLPLTFLGFYKTYFIHFPQFSDQITPFMHSHAAIACVWISMLIAQPLFIRYRKLKWQRRIGKWSYFVFPLLILSFIPQVIRMVKTDRAIEVFFPAADAALLILFYSLAIYYRKKQALHMRYMIGIAIVFLGPTIGRIGPTLLGWSGNFT
ncbi:MAG: hypothetical protein KDC57_05745 [Saprospiraceae bacterium]|nr:hypothetical protein [Saprospiraceae bacterium]